MLLMNKQKRKNNKEINLTLYPSSHSSISLNTHHHHASSYHLTILFSSNSHHQAPSLRHLPEITPCRTNTRQRWKMTRSDVDHLGKNRAARKPPTITDDAIGRFEARSRGLLCEGFCGWGVGDGGTFEMACQLV
jgi:hypothetical protein